MDSPQDFQLSYANPNIGDINSNNKANTPNNMYDPHKKDVNNCSINTYLPQGLEISFILNGDKQLANPNCWDGQAHSLSIFKTSKTLMLDNNNIEKSLIRIIKYVRSNKLLDNTKVDIPAITGFSQTV